MNAQSGDIDRIRIRLRVLGIIRIGPGSLYLADAFLVSFESAVRIDAADVSRILVLQTPGDLDA